MDPIWTKALVLDNGQVQVAFVTMDGIGSDGQINLKAWQIATDQGFGVPFENCIFSSSHSHSGPGAVSAEFLWSIAPATDLLIPDVAEQMAEDMAQAMLQAWQKRQPAQMDIGIGNLGTSPFNSRISHSQSN